MTISAIDPYGAKNLSGTQHHTPRPHPSCDLQNAQTKATDLPNEINVRKVHHHCMDSPTEAFHFGLVALHVYTDELQCTINNTYG